MKARVKIASGDLSSAGGWADERALSVDDQPIYLREYEHLTLVRLLLARHRAAHHIDGEAGASPGDAVLSLLDRLHAAAVEAGRDGSVREIRVLQALTHHDHGDLPQALAALRRSLVDTPEPDRYVRLYLDEGAPMLALLRLAAGTPDSVVQAYARRLLGRATTSVEAAESQQTPGGPFSQRELEVLRLLDSELTGPEIARQLYVTLNTLRTHTKRIFTKLDVTTRAAAVRRAHERGLL
jgi:LuxR family transcriptional regulator, maltose regulon positive regulatory protein